MVDSVDDRRRGKREEVKDHARVCQMQLERGKFAGWHGTGWPTPYHGIKFSGVNGARKKTFYFVFCGHTP